MTTQTSLLCVAMISQEPSPWNVTSRKEVLVTEKKRAVFREIVVQCGIRHSAVQKMIKTLEYQKVCCDWVP
jgi:hypothetical protein